MNASPIIGLDLHTWRFEGVTQRIALCYLAAAILVLWSNRRGQWIALGACLVGYWMIMRFVPVPGFGVPGRDISFIDPDRNLVTWLDRKLFTGHLYNVTRDPEGIISTIPAIATTLMGVLTGHLLLSEKKSSIKATRMLLIGVLGVTSGLIWNFWFPINKNLWTSSFVLFTGGFALVFLAFLYWVLEIKQWRGPWTMPILVFGVNAIVGFVADSLVYGPGYSFTVKGHNGTAISWHDAAQVRLVSFGLNEAKRFIGLFAGCRAVLLDPPVASLAKRDFHQGLTPCRLRGKTRRTRRDRAQLLKPRSVLEGFRTTRHSIISPTNPDTKKSAEVLIFQFSLFRPSSAATLYASAKVG
ncbi:MAG: hypothetical protein DMC59_05200 [Verrucomicrobia bacterium]|nr:MAG: hypothetical protein DMC59_05200 [Verrucomicrobiota bacterium]